MVADQGHCADPMTEVGASVQLSGVSDRLSTEAIPEELPVSQTSCGAATMTGPTSRQGSQGGLRALAQPFWFQEQPFPTFAMNWTLYPGAIAFLTACVIAYIAGFKKLRSSEQRLGAREAGAFALGVILLAVATASPLTTLREDYLFARAIQQVLVAILAPPLLWYGRAVSCIAVPLTGFWSPPNHLRAAGTIKVITGLRFLTGPGVVWAFTLCIFALWHDPTVLRWLHAAPWRAHAGLWIYFGTYFLFWGHAMAMAPRWHTPLPAWLRFLYLIVGGEVANMLLGVSLAFRSFVLYDFYTADPTRGFLTPLQDQMISGAIIWVSGSFVYIFIAMALLGQALFHRPLPHKVPSRDWQRATHRTIAPGLEDRVGQ